MEAYDLGSHSSGFDRIVQCWVRGGWTWHTFMLPSHELGRSWRGGWPVRGMVLHVLFLWISTSHTFSPAVKALDRDLQV